jgi:hypothetical protein
MSGKGIEERGHQNGDEIGSILELNEVRSLGKLPGQILNPLYKEA